MRAVLVPVGDSVPRAIGVMTAAIVAAPTAGSIVGVRFRPGEGLGFLDASAGALRDQAPDLGLLWGAAAGELAARISASGGTSVRVALVQDALRARKRARYADHRVRIAVARLGLGVGVAEVATEAGLSERQLERLLEERVGVGPKRLARILRLQRLVAAMGVSPAWAELARSCGYADQAHLVREVRALSGVSPSELSRDRVGFVQSRGGRLG
jgi:AraC-like DNA-binding protein